MPTGEPILLTIRLFGKLEVLLDGVPLPGLHLREGERLLAFLTLNHGIPVSYRTLAQHFWPAEARQNEEQDSSDYHSTRQAIHSLREALGTEVGRLVRAGKGIVRLDLEGADVDFVRFERLVQSENPEDWREAIGLHHSPLLEGWHDPWVRKARERSQRSLERLSSELAKLPSQPKPVPTPLALPHRDLASVPSSVEPVGGAVPLSSRFYMERETDAEFKRAIARRDSIVLLKGAKQIGKTSLLARGLHEARTAGFRVVLTDFQTLTAEHLATQERFYLTLAQDIADQLQLEPSPHSFWNRERSANRNLERYLSQVVLGAESSPLIWTMDEVDRLFGYDYGGDVFSLFRSWHNRRALDPTGPWQSLTLAMTYATEAHLFISDLNQSPFNIGTRLTLHDFRLAQVAELNRRYGEPLRTDADVTCFYALVSGHPYLTQKGLVEMAGHGLDISHLEAQSDRNDGLFGDHLRRLLASLTQDAGLTAAVRAKLKGESGITEESFYRLRSAGVLTGDTASEACWRCRVYQTYLRRYLL